MTIRAMQAGDWPSVRAIYAEGIATGNATMETEPPSWEAWDGAHLPHSRLVAEESGALSGWAALSPVSERCAYAGVAEVSVYVGEAARGKGLGRALLAALVQSSEQHGVWTLQAGIFPENASSVRIHELGGFRLVGRREKLGKLKGRWRDVLMLERRSAVVGS